MRIAAISSGVLCVPSVPQYRERVDVRGPGQYRAEQRGEQRRHPVDCDPGPALGSRDAGDLVRDVRGVPRQRVHVVVRDALGKPLVVGRHEVHRFARPDDHRGRGVGSCAPGPQPPRADREPDGLLPPEEERVDLGVRHRAQHALPAVAPHPVDVDPAALFEGHDAEADGDAVRGRHEKGQYGNASEPRTRGPSDVTATISSAR